MKNMNEKTKKCLFIAGGLALSAVLVVTIAGQFRKAPIQDVDIPPQSSSSQDVTVNTPDISEKENDIVVPPIQIPEESESANGVDKGTDQTIQPDASEKPTYTEEELTNPEQKPNGEKVDKPTEENPTPPQIQNKPTEKPSNPTGGLPGFDNVPNAGENTGTVVGSDGDINTQVGVMD